MRRFVCHDVIAIALTLGVTAITAPAGAAQSAADRRVDVRQVVTTDMGGGSDVGYAIARQANGRLVVAGVTQGTTGNAFAIARYTRNGRLDGSFGAGGRVAIDLGTGDDEAFAVDVTSKGEIVAGGYAYREGTGADFAIVKLTRKGALDRSFGSGGIVFTDFGGSIDAANAVRFLPDGKILAVGQALDAATGDYDFALARYNADGTLDASFGSAGRVTTDLFAHSSDAGAALALQPDGSIIVVGSTTSSPWPKLALVRYTASGALDPSFGQGGIAVSEIGGIGALALDATGRIVVAGILGMDWAVSRFTADGQLDLSFGTNGIAAADLTGDGELATAVAVEPDGHIVAGGMTYCTQFCLRGGDFVIARYTADGTLDPAFGEGGTIMTAIGTRAEARGMVLLPRDGAVLAGFAEMPDTGWDFALVQYGRSKP